MSLLEQIQIAQRNAGEAAVIASLERTGLRITDADVAGENRSDTDQWTGHLDVDAALIMLDRLDVGVSDNARIYAIGATLRKLAKQLEQHNAGAQRAA
jgi:hypothetical protein